ncbi:hypothetical protein NH340_JMT01362 [Sarcoptes scabiei]|nr:hypothetical protein NH340_JMT01362 [Sarcoptes scabiei]
MLYNINYDIDLEYFNDNNLVNLNPLSFSSESWQSTDPKFSDQNNEYYDDDEGVGKIRNLLKKACLNSLTMAEQKFLLCKLKSDFKNALSLEVNPSNLPGLVENNPIIADEIISIYIRESPLNQSKNETSLSISFVNNCLSTLIEMDTSVHSMEVVNRLSSKSLLPSEYTYRYILNCIRTCENIKDRYLQNRLVRLVCVFLSALIKKEIIDVKDIFLEVQAFCIEFSQIRDAAGLFRFLKQLQTQNENDHAIISNHCSITANDLSQIKSFKTDSNKFEIN